MFPPLLIGGNPYCANVFQYYSNESFIHHLLSMMRINDNAKIHIMCKNV